MPSFVFQINVRFVSFTSMLEKFAFAAVRVRGRRAHDDRVHEHDPGRLLLARDGGGDGDAVRAVAEPLHGGPADVVCERGHAEAAELHDHDAGAVSVRGQRARTHHPKHTHDASAARTYSPIYLRPHTSHTSAYVSIRDADAARQCQIAQTRIGQKLKLISKCWSNSSNTYQNAHPDDRLTFVLAG